MIQRFVVASFLMGGLVLGQGQPSAPVPPERGAVAPGGKFTPSDAGAGEAKGPVLTREEAEEKLRETLKVEKVGENGFRIGQVTFDQKARTVTIPAQVNMESGVVEYVLVTGEGKAHEAVFTTSVKPEQIHLACVLLGVKTLPDDKAFKPGKPVPLPHAAQIHVTWDQNGPAARHPLAKLVEISDAPGTDKKGVSLSDGPWLYNGSRTDQSGFLATREGSIISLIYDRSALVNNTRAGAGRDDHHMANADLLPKKGHPVRIVLTLPRK